MNVRRSKNILRRTRDFLRLPCITRLEHEDAFNARLRPFVLTASGLLLESDGDLIGSPSAPEKRRDLSLKALW
jgi:hypothetical protein